MENGDKVGFTLDLDISGWRKNLNEAGKLGDQFGRSISKVFEDAAFRGKSFSDSLRGVALSLSRMAIRSAFKPIEGAIGSIFGNLASSLTGFKSGGVINGGLSGSGGGVLSGPALFPLSGAKTGIAGEAGPEAILPLSRGSDGRLGVKAGVKGAGITINFNVTSPDAAGFKRSESQITAMLNRAVSRGQRNL